MKVVSSSKDKNYSLLQTKQQVNNWWYLPEEEAGLQWNLQTALMDCEVYHLTS